MRPAKQVSEAVSTALHTETVLYVITQYTQMRAQRQQQLREQQKLLDEKGSAAGSAIGGGAVLTSLDMMPVGDVVFHTLESMGVHTGLRLCERLTASDPLTNFTPEVVSRFIAGQVWRAMFGKGLDHRYGQGITRLTDNNFKWFRSNTFKRFRPSVAASPQQPITSRGSTSRGPSPPTTSNKGTNGKALGGGFRNVTNTLHAAPGHTAAPNSSSKSAPNGNNSVEGPSEAQPMSPPSNSPWEADCGPADFAVYAAGVIKGVLQSLGHPHVAVSFELSGEETSERDVSGTALVGDSGNGDQQQQQPLAFSYVGVKDITFVLDFTVEQAMLMME